MYLQPGHGFAVFHLMLMDCLKTWTCLLNNFSFLPLGSHYSEDICVLHAVSEQNVTKPSCQYSAEMCHGMQSFHFLHAGPCHGNSNLDWAIERAKLSTNSLKKVPCGYDTCYDWEDCEGMTSEW